MNIDWRDALYAPPCAGVYLITRESPSHIVVRQGQRHVDVTHWSRAARGSGWANEDLFGPVIAWAPLPGPYLGGGSREPLAQAAEVRP
jgi:hypothetical protein